MTTRTEGMLGTDLNIKPGLPNHAVGCVVAPWTIQTKRNRKPFCRQQARSLVNDAAHGPTATAQATVQQAQGPCWARWHLRRPSLPFSLLDSLEAHTFPRSLSIRVLAHASRTRPGQILPQLNFRRHLPPRQSRPRGSAPPQAHNLRFIFRSQRRRRPPPFLTDILDDGIVLIRPTGAVAVPRTAAEHQHVAVRRSHQPRPADRGTAIHGIDTPSLTGKRSHSEETQKSGRCARESRCGLSIRGCKQRR